jgi:hypothetical protein
LYIFCIEFLFIKMDLESVFHKEYFKTIFYNFQKRNELLNQLNQLN